MTRGYDHSMHINDEAVEGVMAELAQRDLATLGIAEAVSVVTAALPDLFGVDGAGILLVDDAQVLRYVASTNPAARLLESVQEATGRGPCIQSLVENEAVTVVDIAEDDRWADLGEQLAPSGVRAVLGVPLRVGGASVGSLNVYRSRPYHWDDTDRRAIAAFGILVDRLLGAVLVADQHEALVDQLQRALESRVAIERAVGVVMVVSDVDGPGAFELIRRAARSSRRTVQEVSAEVVITKKLP